MQACLENGGGIDVPVEPVRQYFLMATERLQMHASEMCGGDRKCKNELYLPRYHIISRFRRIIQQLYTEETSYSFACMEFNQGQQDFAKFGLLAWCALGRM